MFQSSGSSLFAYSLCAGVDPDQLSLKRRPSSCPAMPDNATCNQGAVKYVCCIHVCSWDSGQNFQRGRAAPLEFTTVVCRWFVRSFRQCETASSYACTEQMFAIRGHHSWLNVHNRGTSYNLLVHFPWVESFSWKTSSVRMAQPTTATASAILQCQYI